MFITSFISSYSNYTFRTVPLPLDYSLPQPILAVLPGFKCLSCSFKSGNRSRIRIHANQEHHSKRASDATIFTAVQLQSWFKQGKERYWIVCTSQAGEENQDSSAQGRSARANNSDGSGSGSDSDSDSSSGGDRDDKIKAGVARWEKEVKQQRLLMSQEIQHTEINPWLRFTDWPRILQQSQLNLVETYAFTASPTPAEPHLRRVVKVWGVIQQRCLDTLQAVNHKDILKWWASPKAESPNQIPFQRIEKDSLKKYSSTFERLLLYVLRTAGTKRHDQDTITGVKFTRRQWQCVQRVRLEFQIKDANDNDGPLTTAVMALIMSLVTEDSSRASLYDSPVMHYLAVRGVSNTTRTFLPAHRYTSTLAEMLWVIRLVVLEIAASSQGWAELNIPTRAEVGAIEGAVTKRIYKLRSQHLIEGSFSPASSILSQLAYGQALNRVQQSPSNIYWSDNRQTVYYEGKGVAVDKLRSMCQDLVKELQALLSKLLFCQDVPLLPLDQIADNMGSSQAFQHDEYSFIDHADNAKYKVSWEFVYALMQHDPDNRLTQVVSRGRSTSRLERRWVKDRCNAYLAKEKGFLTRLLVAMHVIGGQPARSPEIGSIKVRNSALATRSIYIINGRVAVVTTYDKLQKRRGKTQYIFRCFPATLSQIIAQYLVYVLPFSRVVGKKGGDYLFADQTGTPWIREELSTALAVATAQHLGVRLTVAAWRQVAIAIGNEHLIKATRIWGQDETQDDEAVALGDNEADAEQDLLAQILVRQSGHGSRAAQHHYAIDGSFLNYLGPDLVNAYSQASRAWHRFLQLDGPSAVAKAEADTVVVTSSHRRRASTLRDSPLPKHHKVSSSSLPRAPVEETPKDRALRALRLLYGADATPQGDEQAAALEWLHQPMAPTDSIIIVLATGSGKSVLFFSLAVLATAQTVVVVVPFVSLIHDLLNRGRRYGVHCKEWQLRDQGVRESLLGQPLPQLLVVSADQAVSGDFLHYAKGLELNKQLAAMFFDECHVAFTDTSYRERLRELWQLRYLECPFIGLTATLLLQLEPVLKSRLLIEQAKVFRRSTMRKTIQYRVQDSVNEPPSAAGIRLVQSLPLSAGRRGIVYVRSYRTGEAVSDVLQCPFYQAQADNKDELLQEWRQGGGGGAQTGWIVATGALGTGIDLPGIVYIVHIDRPYGLTSFMQQSGRGGRRGEVVSSYVVLRLKSQGPSSGSAQRRAGLLNAYSVEQVDEDALDEFLLAAGCRRSVLARHFDGILQDADCLSTDSNLCDRCQETLARTEASRRRPPSGRRPKSPAPESGLTSIRRVQATAAVQDQQLLQFISDLQQGCLYCILTTGPQPRSHEYGHCAAATAKGCGLDAYLVWRKALRLAPRHQCYLCGLSQDFCAAVQERRDCEYKMAILPGVFILQQLGMLFLACRRAGFQGEEDEVEKQLRWLNESGDRPLGRPEVNWQRVWRLVGDDFRTARQ